RIHFCTMKTTALSPLCALVCLLGSGISLRGADQPKDKTPWKINGQLEEACSCDAACPCWFNSKPTKMTCGGGQVLFIETGKYGTVQGHSVEGAMGCSTKSVNPPAANPQHHQYEK